MIFNEKEVIDSLKNGRNIKAVFNGKTGDLSYEERSGKILMTIPPSQNGRSPVYIYVLGNSLIKFKNLEVYYAE